MREIKFRAWDKENEIMICPKGILFDGRVVNFSCGMLEAFEGYEIMQYTGLKDKNGTEIYEGDVVYFNDFDSLRTGGYTGDNILQGEVRFFYGGWIVNTRIGHYELHNARENDEELEIIGNIYENPELLEKEQSK